MLTALAQILMKIERDEFAAAETTRENVGAMASHQQTLSLGKAALGLLFTSYCDDVIVAPEQAIACKAGAQQKKRVLMVIDVQDGYDGGFISSLPADAPGSLKFISEPHSVTASYELHSRKLIEELPAGKRMIRYYKVWNRGLDGAASCAVGG